MKFFAILDFICFVLGAVIWWLTGDLYWLVFGVVLVIFFTTWGLLKWDDILAQDRYERYAKEVQARHQRDPNERQIRQVEIEKKRRRGEESRRYSKPFFPEFSAIKKPLGLAILSGGLWFIF